jgi:hypothetical protein
LLLLKFDFTLEINGSEETGRSGMRHEKTYRPPLGDKANAIEAGMPHALDHQIGRRGTASLAKHIIGELHPD